MVMRSEVRVGQHASDEINLVVKGRFGRTRAGRAGASGCGGIEAGGLLAPTLLSSILFRRFTVAPSP